MSTSFSLPAINAYGSPPRCCAITPDHVAVSWTSRESGSTRDLRRTTAGENGCISPDLKGFRSACRHALRTPRGLHAGDRTLKLRALYPNATYHERLRAQYYLASQRGPCIGRCSPYEERFGVDYPFAYCLVFHSGGRIVMFGVEAASGRASSDLTTKVPAWPAPSLEQTVTPHPSASPRQSPTGHVKKRARGGTWFPRAMKEGVHGGHGFPASY